MIMLGMEQAGSATGAISSQSTAFEESVGYLIGREQAGRYSVDYLEPIEVASASQHKVRFIVCLADLPPDVLGFYHTHRRSKLPSVRDLVTYASVVRNLDRELLFVVFSSLTGSYSAVKVSPAALFPVPVRSLHLPQLPCKSR